MKKLLLGGFAVLGILGLVGLHPAYAQGDTAIVKVPFSFVAGNTILPAGSYRVAPLTLGGDVMSIVSVKGGPGAELLTENLGDARLSGSAHFQFKEYGGHYFLAAITIPGETVRGVVLSQGHVATMLARLNAAAHAAAVTQPH
jgi:hypothetical protein